MIGKGIKLGLECGLTLFPPKEVSTWFETFEFWTHIRVLDLWWSAPLYFYLLRLFVGSLYLREWYCGHFNFSILFFKLSNKFILPKIGISGGCIYEGKYILEFSCIDHKHK